MFRRWSAALGALTVASLLLLPQAASAQVRYLYGVGGYGGYRTLGGYGGYRGFGGLGYGGFYNSLYAQPYGLPSAYVAPVYRSAFLYYQPGLTYNPVVNNPFLYRDPVTPTLYGLTPGWPVAGVPAAGIGNYFGRAVAGYPSYAYGGYGGYGSYLGLLNYTAYPGYASWYGGYPSYLAPLPNYVAYPSYTYPNAVWPDYAARLTTTPYVPGITAAVESPEPRMRVGPTYEVASPTTGGDVLYQTMPRIRPALFPVVPVSANSPLFKGGASTKD